MTHERIRARHEEVMSLRKRRDHAAAICARLAETEERMAQIVTETNLGYIAIFCAAFREARSMISTTTQDASSSSADYEGIARTLSALQSAMVQVVNADLTRCAEHLHVQVARGPEGA